MAYLNFTAQECKKGRKFLFRKTETEVHTVGVDYAEVLPEGVYIDTVAATAVDRRTGQAAPSVIGGTSIETDVDGNNTVAVVEITAGLNGHSYDVTLTVTFDDAVNVDQRCIQFNVKPCDR